MTEPTTEEKPAEKPSGGGGSSKAVVLIAIVNLLAVGGLAAYLVLFQKPAPQAAAQPAGAHGQAAEGGHGAPAEGGHGEAAEGGHGEGGAEAPEGVGPIIALEPLVTNLADTDSDRYLKVTIQLRIKSEAARPEVEAHIVPVRSVILMYLSSLTVADTKGSDKKREIQQQVKRLSNEAMPTSRITQVYFTEFVIQ